MSGQAFYFGCWQRAGHHFHEPSMRHARYGDPTELVPWGYDVERLNRPAHYGKRDGLDETEGHAYLHHKDGWTALAFADRSVDSRGGSKSVFCFNAVLDFTAALSLARTTFPAVFERFDFEIVPVPLDEGEQ